MRLVRYQTKTEAPCFGWIYEENAGPLDGTPFGEFRRLEATLPLESVRLLPPVLPGKIICVGRNYAAHAKEHDADIPEVPLIFLKPPSSLIGPGDTILCPPQSQQVEHEAELAVVIGRRGRWIPPEEAGLYILGYTIANDVTARDLQRRDGQWTRGKSFDTFCPLGPWIETDFNPADALVTCHVSGEMRQMASTRDMVFQVPHLIAFASSVMTLEPGD
ncbi:MAG: FAA hydrolase family protein, partial [Chloroflexota bacterium]